jgi:hypothetical protein
MPDLLTCADGAISDFVQNNVGSPPWPHWGGLIPGDTANGWNASAGDWRAQARVIIGDFEACGGVTVPFVTTHINRLRNRTLTTFRDYMVEQAQVATATAALATAKATLDLAKAQQQTVRSL